MELSQLTAHELIEKLNKKEKIDEEIIDALRKRIKATDSKIKAYVRASLRIAVNLLREKFGIKLPAKKLYVSCQFPPKHPHGCREERCPYFKS